MRPARSHLLTLVLILPLAACAATGPMPGETAQPPPVEAPEPPGMDDSDEARWSVPMRPPRPLDDRGIFYVLGAEGAFPRVRYLDGQLSLNDTCAIRRDKKLNRRIPPMYVNGQPIGFC